MIMNKVILAALATLSMASYAHAAMQDEYKNYPSEEEIKKVESERPDFTRKIFQNEKFIKKFQSGEMNGWVVQFVNPSNQTDFMLTYTPKDNKSMILGHVFDENGNNLTSEDNKQIPVINYDGFKKDIESAKVIIDGNEKNKKVIYAFIDPDCIYCHQLWENARPYVGETTIKWIPVSILSEESLGKAAAMLQAKDPSKMLEEHEKAFKETRGIAPLSKDAITMSTAEIISRLAVCSRAMVPGWPTRAPKAAPSCPSGAGRISTSRIANSISSTTTSATSIQRACIGRLRPRRIRTAAAGSRRVSSISRRTSPRPGEPLMQPLRQDEKGRANPPPK